MATVYTQVGEEVVVDLIDGTSTSALGTGNARIAWGTGAGTADKADTTLFAESTEGGGEARQTPTVSQPLADKNQWVATLTAESTKTVTNAGVFNSTGGATLIVKGDFAGITLASTGDKIEFTMSLEQT